MGIKGGNWRRLGIKGGDKGGVSMLLKINCESIVISFFAIW